MRIISQKGIDPMVDLPYEQATLTVSGKFVSAIAPDGTNMLIANYSTPEKAEKAMEKLFNTYMGTFIAKEIEISPDFEEGLKGMLARGFGIITVKQGYEGATFEPANIVFRFPEDSEV